MSLTISSAGLSPSCNGLGKFPNLACHESQMDAAREGSVTIQRAELEAADIESLVLPGDNGEVPGRVFGQQSGWLFERRWYYWSAQGPGIPVNIAEQLHATHGTVVRVEGHCGCPSPREWNHGFAISSYHIDTPAGLKALADTLRSIYDPRKDPSAPPRMGGKL